MIESLPPRFQSKAQALLDHLGIGISVGGLLDAPKTPLHRLSAYEFLRSLVVPFVRGNLKPSVIKYLKLRLKDFGQLPNFAAERQVHGPWLTKNRWKVYYRL